MAAKVRKILAESFGYTETNAARSEIGGGELATGDSAEAPVYWRFSKRL
jgi:hypothetical protein